MKLMRKIFSADKNVSYGRTIPGGIRPRAHKITSLRSRVMATPIPPVLIIPLNQQQGKASRPCVKAGDRVLKYQKIAEAADDSSLNIHAPSSGVVSMIQNHTTININAANQLCIFIETDGIDEEVPIPDTLDWRGMTSEQLLPVISNAGICGMGGAGFPLSKKIDSAIIPDIHTLIINAVECEPFITADQALIREHADEVIQGAQILQHAINAKRCLLAIESDKTDAIEALSNYADRDSIKLLLLDNKYPAGGERQLIQAATGKELPAGHLPAEAGIYVQNAGTVFSIYKAVVENKPCISRVTTLTGEALQTPKNFNALVGTQVSWLFDLCGIDNKTHSKSVAGGSLMGIELMDNSAPISQSTNCLIAGSLSEFPDIMPEQACIRCGYCANACPSGLLPQQLLAYSRCEEDELLAQQGLFDCIECGACSYVCPSSIPLVQYYRSSKERIISARQKKETSQAWQNRFQYHQYRIKKLKDEALSRTSAKPVIDKQQSADDPFSKEQAALEVAAAVARVKAKKGNVIASSAATDGSQSDGEPTA